MSAETDLQTSIGDAILILDEAKKFAISNAKNYAAMELALLTALGTTPDAQPGPSNVLQGLRGQVFGAAAYANPLIASFLPAYARILTIPDVDGNTILRKLYENFALGSKTVKTRAPTFGAVSAGGSNVGTGLLTRLTKDRYAFNIESGSPEAKSALCVQDEYNGGTRHKELFELRGAAVTKAMMPMPGQGGVVPITALSVQDSRRYVRNPGFDDGFDATTGPTGWTMGSSVASFANYTASVYKDILPSTATPAALQFVASDSVKQVLVVNGVTFPRYTPLYAQLAWMRLASATGTLKLKIGSVEVTVDISTGTNGVWNVLRWPLAAPAATAYFDQWNTSNAELKITVTSLATGTVVVDELTCGPYTNFDGTWYALVGGATPFLTGQPTIVGDTFTWTDSYTGAKINEWLARAFPGFYLPGVSGSAETWADPT